MLRAVNCNARYAVRALQLRQFTSVHVSEEVQQALSSNKPVVALESTIISHGMPYPQNVTVAKEVEEVCRQAGAVPATIAVINGFPKVGLHDADFELLGKAEQNNVKKCSRRDLPIVCARGQNAATTVAGTMYLAHKAGIRVFATGGIGGVHREVVDTMDVSADLMELSKTPVAVVCAGIKSILDVPKSLEYLETQGVPVVGFGCDEFPGFFHNNSGVKCPSRMDAPAEVARLLATMEGLEMNTGAVIAVPNPAPADSSIVDAAIQQALEEARQQGIAGWQITPFLLARVNELTGGTSLESNIRLVKNNALKASDIAVALAHIAPRQARNAKATSGGAVSAANQSPSPVVETQAKSSSRPPAPTATSAEHAHSTAEQQQQTTQKMHRVGGRTQIMVIGGAVVDLSTRPLEGKPLLPGTSSPGTLFQSFGGVGRNVAEAAARLGARVGLLSAITDDVLGKSLLEHCASTGIDTKFLKVVPNQGGQHRTATYSAVLDGGGQLHVAVADMRIMDQLSVDDVRKIAIDIRDVDFVVTDGNIDKKTFAGVARLCTTYNVPLVFEPTSVPKAVLPIQADTVGALDIIKPNEKELVAMVQACYEQGLFLENLAQVKSVLAAYATKGVASTQDLRLLGSSLFRAVSRHSINNSTITGIGSQRKVAGKHILISMGDGGLMWVGPSGMVGQKYAIDEQVAVAHLPAIKGTVLSCTGAGDTLLGTVLWGLVNGKSMRGSIIAGMEAARMTITSPFSVSPDLTEAALEKSIHGNSHHYH